MLSDEVIQGVAVRHVRVSGDGVDLHVAVAGDGPPVVLLHGFPENWRSWQHQFAPLVQAGFSVWAPDLRGYNLSGRPPNRRAYHLRHLIADVAAIVRATGCPRAHICGHDWGGVIAWTFAGASPALVDKLVIFNAPHMRIYLRTVWRPPQLFRSWYVLFFLLPRVPERALSARNFQAVRRIFRRMPARPHAFSEDDIDRYVTALSAPGALTAALNYYRANAGSDGLSLASSARIGAETLVLWGDRDPALAPALLTGLDAVAPSLQVVRFADVGHWIQNEAPEEVNPLLIEFLRAPAKGL
jgi:pimeloyl-ACP methyl ester carboxylesterase